MTVALDIQDFKDPFTVILFLKAPILGYVKTRLAKEIGERAALALYKAFVTDILENIKGPNYPLTIFYTPKGGEDLIKRLFDINCPLLPQEGEDLGERMANALKTVFEKGLNYAILIGSDTVELYQEDIDGAFSALKDNDIVIGPAKDGGFYLIGFQKKSFSSSLFKNIPWSSSSTLSSLLKNLEGGLRVGLLQEKQDIDTLEDLFEFYCRNSKNRRIRYTIRVIEELNLFKRKDGLIR